MIDEILTNLGLTDEEAQIYNSLIQNGTQSASKLSGTTKVKRTYIYNVADSLIEKGLVSKKKEGRTTVFTPLSPDHLLTLAHDKKDEAQRVERSLEAILPQLRQDYQQTENRPVVTYYEGLEGIKKVYSDTIRVCEPILALVETSSVQDEVYNWVTNKYVKIRVKKNIPVKAIVSSGKKTELYTGLNKKELRETKVVDNNKFKFENEINIYGNKVAMMKHKRDESLLGIIIDDPLIAKTFRSWFELTWSEL